MSDPYATPELYDIVNTPGTRAQAAGVLRVLSAFSREPIGKGPILEPASGTGRLQRALAARGIVSVGVELHPKMARFARGRARALGYGSLARTLVGDMTRLHELALGDAPFTGAFCTDNTVRHLPTDALLVKHIRSVFCVLGPGAVYVVGIGLHPEEGDFPIDYSYQGRRDGVSVRQRIDFLPPGPGAKGTAARREECYSHTSVKQRGCPPRDVFSAYTLRTYTHAQWLKLLKRANVRELAVVDEQARRLKPTRTAYALRVLGL